MTKKETIQVLQSIEDRAVDFPYMTACDWVAIAAAKRHLENSLEVKEEILDSNDKTKLMQKCVKAAYKRGYDMGVLQTTNKFNHNTKEVNIAEMADDYYDALMKEADWMDVDTMGHCRLAYYTGCKDVLNKLQKGE